MINETDLVRPDGRTLHVYDAVPAGAEVALTVFWHHGTPNIGQPPLPLLPASAARGIRWVSHDRPGYGGSSAQDGRTVGAVTEDVASIADHLGIDRFAVFGHSGGGPHALACAALLADRVTAVVSASGLAPYAADGLDYFAGMVASGEAELRAAVEGPAACTALLASSGFDPEMFTPADHAALAGEWSWFNGIAGQGLENGLGPMVADDVAYVRPWGFDVTTVSQPVLVLQGADDRIVPRPHGEWLAAHLTKAELSIRPGEGHVSVLGAGAEALDWLRANA